MAEQRLPIAPAGLEAAGRLLWKRLNTAYVLQAGGRELLKALCQTEDRLVDVRAALDGAELIVESKQGTRAHPLLSVERDLRATQLRLYRSLGIHEDVEEEAESYDSQRRQLAAVAGHKARRKVL